MNRELEIRVVKQFVYKNKRERVLFELNRADRRDILLDKFDQYLDPTFMHPIRTHIKDAEHLYKVLKETGAGELCYVMCAHKSFDEKIPLMEAIQKEILGGPYLLLLEDNGLAYYESEPEVMSSKYILRR